MGLLFWRKTHDLGEPNESVAVVATEDNPLPVRPSLGDDDDPLKVKVEQDYLPPVAGQTITRIYDIPGIGTGAVYADGEAFGTAFTIHDVFRAEKGSGVVVGAFLLDFDDEGIQVDIPLFTQPLAGTADNSAFAPTDVELATCRGVVSITSFYNWNVNQFGQATNVGLWLYAGGTNLYTQCVIRGAANIAAGAIPRIGIVVVPD